LTQPYYAKNDVRNDRKCIPGKHEVNMYNLSNEKEVMIHSLLEDLDETDLGSIRNTVGQLLSVIADPNSSAVDLTKILIIDPPLSVKILTRANSALLGGSIKIKSIQEAIVRLGYNEVRDLALTQKIFDFFNFSDKYGQYSGKELWKHSIAVALLSKYIFERLFGTHNKYVYTAGLLHDIGIIIENQFISEKFQNILMISIQSKKDMEEIEEVVLGFTHAEIGMVLAEKWQLPDNLIDAIGYHHHPDRSDFINRAVLLCLHLADQIAHQEKIGYSDSRENQLSIQKSMEELKLPQTEMNNIITKVKDEINQLMKEGFL